MYDSIVVTLIAVADFGLLYIAFREMKRKQKIKNSRKFNRILHSVGLK